MSVIILTVTVSTDRWTPDQLADDLTTILDEADDALMGATIISVAAKEQS